MKHLKKTEKRLKDALKAAPLACTNFIEREGGDIETVRCKCCGEKIRCMCEVPAKKKRKREKGKTIEVLVQRMKTLSNFSQVRFFMDDGTTHVSAVCRQCAQGLSAEMLESMFAADVVEWTTHGASERFVEKQMSRRPVRYEIVEIDE